MGYLFLSLSLLAGTTKGYCGKKISCATEGFRDSVFANTVRMLFCIVIGFVLIAVTDGVSALRPTRPMLLCAMLSGVSTAAFVVTWLLSVRKSAYMMLDIFLMLGVLIPILTGSVLFDEIITPAQWLGLGILFLAVVIMCSYNNSIKQKLSFSSFLLLVFCGIANGLTDVSQKLFVQYAADASAAGFQFYTYLFSALVLSAVLLFPTGERSHTHHSTPLGLIFLMAVCLFANSFFKTLAAASLPAVILYPLTQGLALVLSMVMSAVFFREKITPKSVLGILIAFTGLLLINL